MAQLLFQAQGWQQATTLAERLAALPQSKYILPNAAINPALVRGQRRLQRWQTQPPFTDQGIFAQRLAADGMTEAVLTQLLGESADELQSRFPDPPAWLLQIDEALTQPDLLGRAWLPTPDALQEKEWHSFLEPLAPLLNQALRRMRAQVRTLSPGPPALPFDPDTIEAILFANLPGQLLSMVSRTFALELHVARLQGFLTGSAPEERFRSFVQRLCQPEQLMTLFGEYPVLARQLVKQINQWVDLSSEFLQRLCTDWTDLRATFTADEAPGVLTRLEGGGDRHRGGRSVMIATFSSGFKVVYKPKSLAVDQHFQELLAWCNQRGNHPLFRTLALLDRGTHGWVEFIHGAGCASRDEVWRFYERQGGYLALLYALEATDFHYENLIAAGEHPLLIDLEALFQPRAGGLDLSLSDGLAGHSLTYSVLRVGLLPQRIWANQESVGVDVSGLGGAKGQLTPHSVPAWQDAGTDAMRVTRKRVPIGGEQHRPTLAGVSVDVLEYADAITNGFAAIYHLLLRHRDALLADDGLLARFAHDEVRVILRPTQTYATLLHDGWHPDLLRNALDREQHLDRLWVGTTQRAELAKIIASERTDLLGSDIPMFTTHPASRDMWDSQGNPIADFFEEPGLSQVRQRMQQLSPDDLARQQWYIRASLITLALDSAPWPSYTMTEPQVIADHRRLLAAACAVGDRLEKLALRGKSDITWIGLKFDQDRYWSLRPLGFELYDGLEGVALFLAYLGALSGKQRYTQLARTALTTLRRQIEQRQSSLASIGGFSGWGGSIYLLTQLGVLWDQPDLLDEAMGIVAILPEAIAGDEHLDVIGGAVGCIGGLLSLAQVRPSEQLISAATQCGDRLLARAQPMQHGIGWATALNQQPLAGFSHGAAGIAWALLELNGITGETRFRDAAIAALRYERSLFVPGAGNWPDLRLLEEQRPVRAQEQQKYMSAWCHGAAGIGLARLRALCHLDDPEIVAEIDIALRTTLAQGFGRNHSLCHGDLGNLDLLLSAGEALDDPYWRLQTQRLAAGILESIGRDGWLCGAPLGVESPGLMTGLAGIGYQLLRLTQPTKVPSVLVMAPPSDL